MNNGREERIKPYILGYIYYEIAKRSFRNEYNEKRETTNIYIDTVITIMLIIVNILEITEREKLDRRIIPVVFGDCLYHIYELYREVRRGEGEVSREEGEGEVSREEGEGEVSRERRREEGEK